MMAMDGEPLSQVAEWRLNSGGVFMRASDDEGGKLARLADVRDWLMHRNEWPMERAAEEIVKKLREAHKAGVPLFMGSKKAYALPLRPDDHMLSPQALQERGGLFGLDERLQGFAGVCNAIINGWLGEYAGYGGTFARIDAVCVRAADAAQLWGWGSVGAGTAAAPTSAPMPGAAVADPLGALDAELRAAFEAVCKRRALSKRVKNGAREPWPVDDVETVRKVRETLGRSGAKTIAPMLGMTQDAVRDLLERKAKAKAKAAATTANNPFGQVRPKAA